MSSDLRPRVLMWHRILAQMTGTLSLTYGANGLKKGALQEWISNLDTVSADMRSVMEGTSSKLDEQTRGVLKSAARTSSLGDVDSGTDRQFFGKTERKNEVIPSTRARPNAEPVAGAGKVTPKPLKTATRKTGV